MPPVTTPETEEILSLENAVLVSGGAHRVGDIHVCPEGLFFIAGDQSRKGCLIAAIGLGLCAVGIFLAINHQLTLFGLNMALAGVMIVALGLVTARRASGSWRRNLAGQPLDELVRAVPNSQWITPVEMTSLTLTEHHAPDIPGLLIKMTANREVFIARNLIGRDDPGESMLRLFERARLLGWPVSGEA